MKINKQKLLSKLCNKFDLNYSKNYMKNSFILKHNIIDLAGDVVLIEFIFKTQKYFYTIYVHFIDENI